MSGVKAGDLLTRIVGPLTLLAAFGLVGTYYTQGKQAQDAAARDRQIVECQSSFNIAVIENLRIRFALTGRALDASERLLTGAGKLVLNEPRGPEEEAAQAAQYRRLFGDYADAVETRRAFAAANPFPDYPTCDPP